VSLLIARHTAGPKPRSSALRATTAISGPGVIVSSAATPSHARERMADSVLGRLALLSAGDAGGGSDCLACDLDEAD